MIGTESSNSSFGNAADGTWYTSIRELIKWKCVRSLIRGQISREILFPLLTRIFEIVFRITQSGCYKMVRHSQGIYWQTTIVRDIDECFFGFFWFLFKSCLNYFGFVSYSGKFVRCSLRVLLWPFRPLLYESLYSTRFILMWSVHLGRFAIRMKNFP